jgi:hypothetical protein
MKKPSNLNLKDPITKKRNKGIQSDYEVRKQKYAELKELRQKLKQKKTDKIDDAKKERQRLIEKKKRKEINDLKSGQYQVVISILF